MEKRITTVGTTMISRTRVNNGMCFQRPFGDEEFMTNGALELFDPRGDMYYLVTIQVTLCRKGLPTDITNDILLSHVDSLDVLLQPSFCFSQFSTCIASVPNGFVYCEVVDIEIIFSWKFPGTTSRLAFKWFHCYMNRVHMSLELRPGFKYFGIGTNRARPSFKITIS